ncbi:MAG: alpha/beta fold hydrolase [Thiohalorhabdus sp.]|uniref:alpha/beta fold hydrolase n=1 Tax=Thiohalorhabdus sp. TaxID=3094134 RepID=UPI002FC35F67
MREDSVQFGGSNLIGVVSEPEETEPPRGAPGIILLNSGLIPKMGPNRLYVTLARRLARQGFTVLRFDLSAIGDSPARSDTRPFRESSVIETQEAMDFLARTRGIETFLLGGICTGAVVAFRTALVAEGVQGIAMINAQDLVTEQPAQAQAYVRERAGARYYLRTALRQPRSWGRLLAGRASYRAIASALRTRIAGSRRGRQPLATAEAAEVRQGLQRFADPGTPLLLLYAEGDRGLDELDLILGDDRQWLDRSPWIDHQVVPGADHMFTLRDKQAAFLDHLEHWAQRAAGQTAGGEAAPTLQEAP